MSRIAPRNAASSASGAMSAAGARAVADRELARDHQCGERVDERARSRRNTVRERRVQHERDDAALRPELDDARREDTVLHLASDGEEGEWQIDDDTADGHFGGDVVLIGVRADQHGGFPLAHRLKYSEPGRISRS